MFTFTDTLLVVDNIHLVGGGTLIGSRGDTRQGTKRACSLAALGIAVEAVAKMARTTLAGSSIAELVATRMALGLVSLALFLWFHFSLPPPLSSSSHLHLLPPPLFLFRKLPPHFSLLWTVQNATTGS